MFLRRLLARSLARAAAVCQGLSRRIDAPLDAGQSDALRAWFGAQGDRTLRLQYELDQESVVLDVGGYEGQWASDVFAMYCCRIHILEPVPAFADDLEKRFATNDRIRVHRFGLAGCSRSDRIHVIGDGSSVLTQSSDDPTIELVGASEFFSSQQLDTVHLMKVNIEGGEYELLEHMIEHGLATRVRNIQVQFHPCLPQAEARMRRIQAALQQTHTLTFQYLFVWENWRLRLG